MYTYIHMYVYILYVRILIYNYSIYSLAVYVMAESGRSNESIDPKTDPKHKANSADPGWKYGYWPNPEHKECIECILCGKQVKQGINRLKQHLAANYADVSKCPNTTTEIMKEMREALISKKRKKPIILDDMGDDSDNDVQEISGQNTQSTGASVFVPSSGTSAKRKRATTLYEIAKPQVPPPRPIKTVVSMLRKTPEEVVHERHRKDSKQTTLENIRKTPEEKERVYPHIAKFFYACGIPFNVANSRHYEVMIESVGQYGPGLKPPSYHELRVPLLEKVKKQTDQLRTKHESAWKKYGCTLMSDGWTDRRGRHLINFLANSPDGTFFMGSVDASSESHDHLMLADLLQSKIEEIGKEYVVQIVTDNGANYKKACQLLTTERFPTMFWTPCAAHCIDLMLEDIGSYKVFDATIKNAKRITTFIYRHGRLHHAMTLKTGGRELVRPGATRFATSFLTLQCLCKFQDSLRQLFIDGDWRRSNLSKTEAGKQIYDLVISTPFWNNVGNCIRAAQPLLVALRVVDADEQPAMPDIIAAMELAKETIRDSFKNNASLCKFVIDIIDKRWDTQMGVQLYSAGLFLNPGKFFDIQEKDYRNSCKLREDFNDVLEKMVSDVETRNTISNQTDNYEHTRENFARQMAIDQRKMKSPRK